MTSSPARSAESRISSIDERPSPRSLWSWRSALPIRVPHRLEHRPLFGALLDVALEDRGEPLDAGAHVGVAVAGRGELDGLLDPREEEAVLAPRERRNEGRTGTKRERDVRRGEQGWPPEEIDLFAHARYRAVGEDPEHTAVADHPMDAERRIHRHQDQALRLPRPVHRVHEFGIGLLRG